MHASSRYIVTFLRGGLWIVSFYILGVLCKIYYYAGVDIKNAINVLGIGILFFTLFVIGILYQTQQEDDCKKQTVHILKAAVLLVCLYGLCSLLVFGLSDKWTAPYLWF